MAEILVLFYHLFSLINWHENRVNLLFFSSSNMAAVTSRANQQYENLVVIYIEFDNKTPYVFSRHENPTRHCSFNTKAWNVINHIIHINHIIMTTYLAFTELVLWWGHLTEFQNLTLSTIFLSKNSAQLQNFTSCNCWGVNLVHCSVLCIEWNFKRALL